MKVLCSRCHQNEANTCATGRWLCWSCFHLEPNKRPKGHIERDELSVLSRAVLRFIRRHLIETGIAPNMREIVQNVNGCSSTSVARAHLLKLEQAGEIRRVPKAARGIVIVMESEQ